MTEQQDQVRPDFAMVGITDDNAHPHTRVILIASTELSQVELRSEVKNPGYYFLGSYVKPTYLKFLTAEMRTYVIVQAATYQEAFQKLFSTWDPRGSAPHHPPSGPPKRGIR